MTILIVEDEPSIAGLWGKFLKPLGAEMRFATTLLEAQFEMSRFPPADLVLLDLRMPGSTPEQVMEGIEELKKKNPYAVVIVVTGMTDASMPILAEKFGADGFQLKTEVTSQNKLLSAVRVALIRNKEKTPEEPAYERNLALIEMVTSLVTVPPIPGISSQS